MGVGLDPDAEEVKRPILQTVNPFLGNAEMVERPGNVEHGVVANVELKDLPVNACLSVTLPRSHTGWSGQ